MRIKIINKTLLFYFAFCLLCSDIYASDSLKVRKKIIYTGIPTLAVTTSSALYVLWYKDYSSGNFHFFNDNHEWLGMDKVGHGVANFHTMNNLVMMYQFAGMEKRKAYLYSALLTLGFFTSVEIMDGFSDGWGFSHGDIIANISGLGLWGLQQHFWGEQIFTPKFSFYPSSYRKLRPNILGENMLQSIIKDYNAQTYWMSYSFKRHNLPIPKWLCVSIGYSIDGLVGARNNEFISKGVYYNYNDIPRERQFLFSLDLDLSQIQLKNEWLNLLLHNFEFVKFPFPAIGYQKSRGVYLGF